MLKASQPSDESEHVMDVGSSTSSHDSAGLELQTWYHLAVLLELRGMQICKEGGGMVPSPVVLPSDCSLLNRLGQPKRKKREPNGKKSGEKSLKIINECPAIEVPRPHFVTRAHI